MKEAVKDFLGWVAISYRANTFVRFAILCYQAAPDDRTGCYKSEGFQKVIMHLTSVMRSYAICPDRNSDYHGKYSLL
ncbi:hypothetical protein HN011_000135 [Eciton burchellii]|nr:hypothetical protein HN011_000135 [Eciton burchellii]